MSTERMIEGEGLLLKRSKAGDVGGVEALLQEGVNVNAETFCGRLFFKSENNWTPLHWAVVNGNVDVAKLLIEYGANVDVCDMYDITPVHLAAEKGHVDLLQLLVDSEASVTPKTLYKLPQWGITRDYPYRGGTTPLHLATKNNHLDCMKVLFDAGADYNATDEDGRTSLYVAAEKRLEAAVLSHLQNSRGKPLLSIPLHNTDDTPLHQCVIHSMVSAVRGLLISGSDVNFLNRDGYSPLHLALNITRLPASKEIIRTIVTKGYRLDLNRADANGLAPLEYVCFAGSKHGRIPELAALFIAYGAKFTHLKYKKKITLLEQELQQSVTDYIILYAIVKSLSQLPHPSKIRGLETPNLCRLMTVRTPDCSRHLAKRQWYTSIASSVRSLRHHCRYTIRTQMGPSRLNLVHQLPLPCRLQNYLIFKCDDCI